MTLLKDAANSILSSTVYHPYLQLPFPLEMKKKKKEELGGD